MKKVLLIGLDSADAELIQQWMQSGHLPNFSKLCQQGAWGDLGTTAEYMHVSAWPTLYTGVMPGHHGMDLKGSAPSYEVAVVTRGWGSHMTFDRSQISAGL